MLRQDNQLEMIVQGEALFFRYKQPLVSMSLEEAMSPRSCSITWHSFSPWHNLSKLSSAHGLPKELLLVVKVVQVVFPIQQAATDEPYSGALRIIVVAPNVKSVSL